MIEEDGNQVGIVAVEEALKAAADKGLDLVEISPKSSPPVCKIMDYGKYKYQLEISEKKVKSYLQNGKRNLKICLEGKHVR